MLKTQQLKKLTELIKKIKHKNKKKCKTRFWLKRILDRLKWRFDRLEL